MNPTRNGKIARLPRAVRLELNRRLDEGEQGKKLVVWLNALPEVQAIVAAEFGGKPIREQNLSEWKQGGYRDWVAQQEALKWPSGLARMRRNGTARGAHRSPKHWRSGRSRVMPSRHGVWPKRMVAKDGACCAKCAATSSSFEKAITARSGSKSSANG